MDWMILLIVVLLAFLAWHVTTSPHPEEAPRDAADPVQQAQKQQKQQKQKGAKNPAPPAAPLMIQKASTVFAEPGLSGQVIDPVPTARRVPLEAPMFSTVAMPF